ncbi:hypothetical protein ACFQS1_37115 [Paractinoplanes rhizophilus]|uniref:Uncharacterized protein n=1 Tax=Paractinoplanes rhizophilus TaxID=1416877 RepID=A0ABW2I3Y1_9ACTN
MGKGDPADPGGRPGGYRDGRGGGGGLAVADGVRGADVAAA